MKEKQIAFIYLFVYLYFIILSQDINKVETIYFSSNFDITLIGL